MRFRVWDRNRNRRRVPLLVARAQGGTFLPNPLTWLDRTLVDLAVALAGYTCRTTKADFRWDTLDSEGSDSDNDGNLGSQR